MSWPDVAVTSAAPLQAHQESDAEAVAAAVLNSIRIRFPDVDQRALESVVHEAVMGFAHARIPTFVGILVEREAARLIAERSQLHATGRIN